MYILELEAWNLASDLHSSYLLKISIFGGLFPVQFLTWHVEHLARPLVAEAVGLGNGDHVVDDRGRELDLRGVRVPERCLRRRRHSDVRCICRLPEHKVLEQRNHKAKLCLVMVSVQLVRSVQTLTLQQWNVVGGVAMEHEGLGLL
jgi:hypothetical protein